jgi:arylsulfatase A-like enzyme
MSVGRGFDRGFDLYDVYDYGLEAQLAGSRVFSGVCRLSGLLGDMLREHHAILWLQGSPPFITTRLSFDVYDEELNDRLFRFADLTGGRPQFLYVQYVAPHTPYLPHPVGIIKTQPAFTPENSALLKGLYDGEVEYTDRVFADLMKRLERTGFLKDAIVVFTSDHGEEFKEHGRWKHGHTLYQQGLRVPVIIKAPGLPAGSRIGRRVSLLDIAPTLLDLAGVPAMPSCRGRSLKPLALGQAEDLQPRAFFSDVASRHLNPNHNLFSVTQDDWKIIRRRRTSGDLVSEELYDLGSDPAERRRLIPEETGGLAADLRTRLDEFEKARRERRGQSISDEEMQRLRALGYVR